MASQEIVVDPQFLTNLSNRIHRCADDLEMFSTQDSCRMASSPPVSKAYTELSGRWDEKRKALANSLEGLAKQIWNCKQAFEQDDAELSSALAPDA